MLRTERLQFPNGIRKGSRKRGVHIRGNASEEQGLSRGTAGCASGKGPLGRKGLVRHRTNRVRARRPTFEQRASWGRGVKRSRNGWRQCGRLFLTAARALSLLNGTQWLIDERRVVELRRGRSTPLRNGSAGPVRCHDLGGNTPSRLAGREIPGLMMGRFPDSASESAPVRRSSGLDSNRNRAPARADGSKQRKPAQKAYA